ncbi:cell wall metabolism sensor histidine kinase WalK [Jeotgalibacillus sp. R-1-5s-1]|uniref:sensor histidine kinase n=1 Tax=Jeotgalibacillus sp. R-1-5s-1 TaxID=2555897 RepID=UPI00106CEA5E|nr:HAMP domain-containing sensor histidine kinase [Jeotgalibacillus sp. R-1-5s-1]TFE00761.1 HAMP domain-containing protein [Jeotgalibacillus sp. R-1-5s-1]
MKQLNFSRKILLLLLGSIAVTLISAFIFLHFSYRDLYLTTVRESVEYQGQRTASHYHSGELSEEIIEKIHWYNVVSEYEVLVADNLDELNTSFPYQIGDERLIEEGDRAYLESGRSIMKEGYVEAFNREVIGAVYPITDGTSPVGYIYIFVPLEGLAQVFGSSIPWLIGMALVFFLLISLLVNQIRKSLFKPLLAIQDFSKSVSMGSYHQRLEVRQLDEIGQVSQALNQMTQTLEVEEERKKEFLSNIVHEVRTPLTYIQGYTERLKKAPEAEKEVLLSTIESEVGRMNRLLSDLVELNRLQENQLTFDLQPIVAAELLYETLGLFSILAKERGLTFEIEADEEVIMLQDEKRLQQVFYNVIENAVKYSPENTVIQLALKEDLDVVRFEVTNEARLTKAEKQRIGERFYRADRDRNRKTGGTGLGLAIVKEIVRVQGGQWLIDADVDQLFTVRIMLPKEGIAQ